MTCYITFQARDGIAANLRSPHLTDVVAAMAHRRRASSVRHAARVEERVVLRERVPAARRDCNPGI